MNTIDEFVSLRLTPSPKGSHWLSLFVSSSEYEGEDLADLVESKGAMCQTISASHLSHSSPEKFMQVVSDFMETGFVVIITCQNQEQLMKLFPVLSLWEDSTYFQKSSKEDKGRLFVLLNNTKSTEFQPQLQHIADYTYIID